MLSYHQVELKQYVGMQKIKPFRQCGKRIRNAIVELQNHLKNEEDFLKGLCNKIGKKKQKKNAEYKGVWFSPNGRGKGATCYIVPDIAELIKVCKAGKVEETWLSMPWQYWVVLILLIKIACILQYFARLRSGGIRL